VECASFVADPTGGLTLAQLGADVIRIDPVGGASDQHRWPVAPDGESYYWTSLNKGKRSVALDMRSPNGLAINDVGTDFGEDHLLRSAVAHSQIFVNAPSEALYPVCEVDFGGEPLDGGAHRYRLTFEAGTFPRSTPSGPSTSTTRRACWSPTRSTGTPSATGHPDCTSTRAGHSRSRSRLLGRRRRPTGSRYRRAGSA
jgi:2-methylfumaryl-CoA isomerase